MLAVSSQLLGLSINIHIHTHIHTKRTISFVFCSCQTKEVWGPRLPLCLNFGLDDIFFNFYLRYKKMLYSILIFSFPKTYWAMRIKLFCLFHPSIINKSPADSNIWRTRNSDLTVLSQTHKAISCVAIVNQNTQLSGHASEYLFIKQTLCPLR